MRSMFLVLLVPVLALAAANMPTKDIVAPEQPVRDARHSPERVATPTKGHAEGMA